MKKISLLLLLSISSFTYSQSPYAPAAGQPGTTAIPYDSTCFVAWATAVNVTRGYVNIGDTTVQYQGSNKATFGTESDAVGPASAISTASISLGDSGVAIATFAHPITNGTGYDFAIFENGVTDNFLELGLVEVSSDGIHYVRFPAHSLTQTTTQISSFGSVDPTQLNNLAGKYRAGFGTPFDLDDISPSSGIDLQHITHVKVIDCIGSIGSHCTYDADGNKINELFPTPFNTGGFDLSGVGVINEDSGTTSSLPSSSIQALFTVFPNPTNDGYISIHYSGKQHPSQFILSNSLGETIKTIHDPKAGIRMHLSKGIYYLHILSKEKLQTKKIIVR